MPKHKELNINRKFNGTREAAYGIKAPRASEYLRPVRWNGDEDAPGMDYRESAGFKSYRSLIEKTLKKLKRPVTIREIHTALGENAVKRFTYDALETSNNVLWFKGYIDRFVWFAGVHKPEPMMWNGNGQLAIADRPKRLTADLGLQPRITA